MMIATLRRHFFIIFDISSLAQPRRLAQPVFFFIDTFGSAAYFDDAAIFVFFFLMPMMPLFMSDAMPQR
jgi:hypothetical protein